MTRAQFKEIFDRHFDSVRNYLYYRSGDAETASDIAQEVFLKVWEKQPTMESDHVAGLLFKIARDQFISHYRKQKAFTRFALAARPETAGRSAEEQIILKEMNEKFEVVLAGLPEKQRTVFLMSRMDQLKYHEIALRLGVSVKAIEKRMTLALSSIKRQMGS